MILTEGVDGVLSPKFFKKVMRKDLTVIEEKGEEIKEEVMKKEIEKPVELKIKKVEE